MGAFSTNFIVKLSGCPKLNILVDCLTISYKYKVNKLYEIKTFTKREQNVIRIHCLLISTVQKLTNMATEFQTKAVVCPCEKTKLFTRVLLDQLYVDNTVYVHVVAWVSIIYSSTSVNMLLTFWSPLILC